MVGNCMCGKARNPCFGYKHDNRPTRCSSCKENNMIDLKHKYCFCGKARPTFGFEHEKKPTRCVLCKDETMIDVVNKKCQCGKAQPIFGFEHDKKPTRCASCKDNTMIDLIGKKCQCGKARPTFGFENDKRPTRCVSCKDNTMIDIRNKKCQCGKAQPTFGFENDKRPTRCVSCKDETMIDVVSKKCLCGKAHPTFGFENDKRPTRCVSCKDETMIDLVNKLCLSEWCTTRVTNKYEGYCLRCFINLYPDKPLSRNYKTKEIAVNEYIDEYFGEVSWVNDKSVNISGCSSKKRPDKFLDMGDYVILIEVDENSHDNYSCENKRICSLFQDAGNRPMYIIRFNPDDYMNDAGDKVYSCWGYDTRGISRIKYKYKKLWDIRLETLKHVVEQCIHVKPQKEIETIQLYYDGYQ